jgi:hypothetical protein
MSGFQMVTVLPTLLSTTECAVSWVYVEETPGTPITVYIKSWEYIHTLFDMQHIVGKSAKWGHISTENEDDISSFRYCSIFSHFDIVRYLVISICFRYFNLSSLNLYFSFGGLDSNPIFSVALIYKEKCENILKLFVKTNFTKLIFGFIDLFSKTESQFNKCMLTWKI